LVLNIETGKLGKAGSVVLGTGKINEKNRTGFTESGLRGFKVDWQNQRSKCAVKRIRVGTTG